MPVDAADDFQTATAEQRCLVMLVERVGALEDSVGKVDARLETLHRMIGDLHRCMTASYICSCLPTTTMSGTPEMLASIVEAVQQDPLIVVEHAWLVSRGGYMGTDVFLKLGKCVIAEQVSDSIRNHVAAALEVPKALLCDWRSVQAECFQQKLQKTCEGKDGATLTVHEWDRRTAE
jgi:hypothetical protein